MEMLQPLHNVLHIWEQHIPWRTCPIRITTCIVLHYMYKQFIQSVLYVGFYVISNTEVNNFIMLSYIIWVYLQEKNLYNCNLLVKGYIINIDSCDRYHQIIFYESYTRLYSYKQDMSVSLSIHVNSSILLIW